MSEQEIKELTEKLDYGLKLAEKRMLHDKASKGEDVIVCDKDHNIIRIPASEVIANNPIFQ
jgi:hypothetical protein